MTHEHPIIALIPFGWNDIAVVEVEQLLNNLAGGEPLSEAVVNAAFDSVWISPSTTPEQAVAQIRHHMERIRKLNETGDAKAYWESESEEPDDET